MGLDRVKREIRDRNNIFQKIRHDLVITYGVTEVAAVGSRVHMREGVKNDFDVLARVPSVIQLREAMSPEQWLFCVKSAQQYGIEGPEDLFNVYLFRTMPILKSAWSTLLDEYGNPVRADISWVTGPFPDHAILL